MPDSRGAVLGTRRAVLVDIAHPVEVAGGGAAATPAARLPRGALGRSGGAAASLRGTDVVGARVAVVAGDRGSQAPARRVAGVDGAGVVVGARQRAVLTHPGETVIEGARVVVVAVLRESTLRVAAPAFVHTRHPLGVVDEGVPVALELEDQIVAGRLGVIHGVFVVPEEQVGEHAHVAHGLVVAGVAGADELLVVAEHQIRLGVPADPVGSSFVAQVRVQQGPGDVPPARQPHLPRASLVVALSPVRPARILAGPAPVRQHRLLLAARVAVAEGGVSTRRVVRGVSDEEHVAVRVGVVANSVIREPIRAGPGVLSVVQVVAAPRFGVGGAQVQRQDIVRRCRVLFGQLQDVPGVRRVRRVGVAPVIVDRDVQRAPRRLGGARVDPAVVASRRCSDRTSRGAQHRHAPQQQGETDVGEAATLHAILEHRALLAETGATSCQSIVSSPRDGQPDDFGECAGSLWAGAPLAGA